MTPRQRAVLVALGGAVAIIVAVLIGMAAAGSGHSSRLAATTATTGVGGDATPSTTATTPTTLELLPVMPTVAPPTPTSTPAATSPTSAPATTTSTPPPTLNGSGAVLVPAATADERVEAPGAGCASLADAGWSGVRCGVAHASGATLTWLIESRPADPSSTATRGYVFRLTPRGTHEVVLQALDDNGQRFTSVQARVGSVEGGGAADIVFGFRNQGSAEVLSLDLVQGPGVVAVHQDLYRGVARTGTGQLDTWSAVLAAGEPNCCPSAYQHDTIRYLGGAWKLVGEESVAPSAVPPSQL